LHKEPKEEKKPGLLKRIFKRRKNKDTGVDEDYSTDEEEDLAHHDQHALEAGVIGGAGAGAATELGGAKTTHESHHQPAQSSYGAESGGFVKPSYNPLKKDPFANRGQQSDSLSQGHGTTGAYEPVAGPTGMTGSSNTGGAHRTGGADTNLAPGVGTHMDNGPSETTPGRGLA
jgi:hypothetical protein